MRGPIAQTGHIAYEVGYFLISLVSRVWNAINGGSMHQTFSARTHIEARTARKRDLTSMQDIVEMQRWIRLERRIDRLFLILTLGYNVDHCAGAWDSEVTRALKTLQRNGNI